MAFTEAKIIESLNSKYIGNCKYKVPNVYVFKHDWESDFFLLKDNGYCYEFEIKISRQDFKADIKKVSKHLILKDGKYIYKSIDHIKVENEPGQYPLFIWEHKEVIEERIHALRPNKFFYVVPENMVKVEELPAYAGLMYVNEFGSIRTIREAPFIHKEKLNFDAALVNKFYVYWHNEKANNWTLKVDNDRMRKLLEKNNIPFLSF